MKVDMNAVQRMVLARCELEGYDYDRVFDTVVRDLLGGVNDNELNPNLQVWADHVAKLNIELIPGASESDFAFNAFKGTAKGCFVLGVLSHFMATMEDEE